MERMQSHIDNLMSMIKAQPVGKVGGGAERDTGKKSVESFRNHCVIEQKITRKSIEACDFV